MCVAFAKYAHFFSKNISIFNDQSFNDKLINYIVSFEQLVPVYTAYEYMNETERLSKPGFV